MVLALVIDLLITGYFPIYNDLQNAIIDLVYEFLFLSVFVY